MVIFFIGATSCGDDDDKELYEKQYEDPQTDAEKWCASEITDQCLEKESWEQCIAAYEECGVDYILDSCPPQFGCDG